MALGSTDTVRVRFATDGQGNVKVALAQVEGGLDRVDRTAGRLPGTLSRVRGEFMGLGSAIAGIGFGLLIREIIQTSDQMTLLSARIRLFTESAAEAARVEERLFEIAQRTRTALGTVSDLFAKLAMNKKEIGLTNDELLSFTETLTQLITISGANGMEGANAIRQLVQGLSSGQLRGEELRSVMEQLPALVDVVVAKMNEWGNTTEFNRAKFRELAFEGKISAEIITQAVLQAAEETDEKFSQIPVTIGQAFQQIQNTLTAQIGDLRGSGDSVEGLVDSIQDLNKTLSDPEVKEGLQNLFTGVIKLVSWTAKAAAGFAELGKQIGNTFGELATGSALGSDEAMKQRLAFLRDELTNAKTLQSASFTEKGPLVVGEAYKEALGLSLSLASGDYASLTDRIATLGVSGSPARIAQIEAAIEFLEKRLGIGVDNGFRFGPVATDTDAASTTKPASTSASGVTTQTPTLIDYQISAETQAALNAQIGDAINVDLFKPEEIKQELGEVDDAANESAASMSVYFEQAARNIQDTLGQAFYNIFTGVDQSLSDLVGSFARTLAQMASQALAAGILQEIFGEGTGGGNSNGMANFFASMFGADSAGGGFADSNSVRKVNEHGPELVSFGGHDYLMMGENMRGNVKPLSGGGARGGGDFTAVKVGYIDNSGAGPEEIARFTSMMAEMEARIYRNVGAAMNGKVAA